jgi:hypothetical protein
MGKVRDRKVILVFQSFELARHSLKPDHSTSQPTMEIWEPWRENEVPGQPEAHITAFCSTPWPRVLLTGVGRSNEKHAFCFADYRPEISRRRAKNCFVKPRDSQSHWNRFGQLQDCGGHMLAFPTYIPLRQGTVYTSKIVAIGRHMRVICLICPTRHNHAPSNQMSLN